MSFDLFRKEAVEHKRTRLQGSVILIPHISYTLTSLTALVFIAFLLIWSVNLKIYNKETVHGWVVEETGVINIFPDSKGVISEIFVKESERVVKDQPLFAVGSKSFAKVGDNVEATIIKDLAQRIDTNKSESVNLQAKYDDNIKSNAMKITYEEKILSGLKKKNQTLQVSEEIMNSQRRNMDALIEKKYISQVEYDNLLLRIQDLNLEMKNVDIQILSQKKLIGDLVDEKQQLRYNFNSSKNEINQRIGSLTQERETLKVKEVRVYRAPVNGVISNLQYYIGDQIYDNQQSPVLSLVPSNSKKQGKILIPAKAVGFMQEGLKIKIRYEALPYQKFGTFNGILRTVSQNGLLPKDISGYKNDSTEPFYLGVVEILDQEVTVGDRVIRLPPGATFTADIKLESRNLLQMIFSPIYSFNGRL